VYVFLREDNAIIKNNGEDRLVKHFLYNLIGMLIF
jgi:hypothetical protein